MSLFRRRSWPPAEFPDMTFGREPPFVDIGYLAHEEHRRAFVDLYQRVLLDNADVLAGFSLASIRAKNEIDQESLGLARLPTELTSIDPVRFAEGLYDSGNEIVQLRLERPDECADLRIMFDDPWFELLEAAS